jgi:pyruvate/2-oxoglutarate dehydrogenase complex dihydrolipoamide dehydrogenase (E3) component
VDKYDAIVIGSGQAGNPLAQNLADRGWKVALIERAHLGGTCINTGCTPTKTMVMCAQVAHYARNAATWGVHSADGKVDLQKIVERKSKIVEDYRSGLEKKVEQRNDKLHLYRGHGRFLSPRQLSVGDRSLEGKNIFINTGTRSMIPAIDGLEKINYLTNATIMELIEVPEHLLVLGGGYIGMEFGQMFRRFGSRVTVVHNGDRPLNREDPDVTAELQKALEAEGIQFILDAKTAAAQKLNGRILLSIETKDLPGTTEVTGSHLLVATGRRPNTDELDLQRAGVEVDAKGFIKVNNRLETNVPGIWALGDVKGGPAFTHISYNDFQIVYGNLVEGKNLSTEGRHAPYAVFTDPQLGRVGMTETEARRSGRRLKIGKIPMSWVSRAIERGETAGLMKIIVDAKTDRVLGAAILSTEGGELIHILGTLMLAGAPYTTLKGAIYIHPTLAEGLWTLMDKVTEA